MGHGLTRLAFGNDRQVLALWPEQLGSLLFGVRFYFLSGDGALEEMEE